MKYIGIDYGSKRVGVAVSDAEGKIAFPRTTLPNDGKLIGALQKTMEEEGTMQIIIGDTRTVSGQENPITPEAENFAKRLEEAAGAHVQRIYEAWSSVEASRYAPQGHEHNDASAAAILLQRFLDTRAHRI